MLKQKGFSLIELLVTVTLVGILSSVAIPNMRTFLNNQQIQAATNLTYNVFVSARTEAIKQNSRISAVRSANTNNWCLIDRTIDNITTTCNSASNTLENGVVKKFIDPSSNVTLTLTPASSTAITYNSLGQIITNADNSAPISEISVKTSDTSAKEKRVLLGIGVLKMCDPSRPSGDPQKC